MRVYRLSELDSREIVRLCSRNPISDPQVMKTCRQIFEEVAKRGDEAVREFTQRFDGVELDELRVPSTAVVRAVGKVDGDVLSALEKAASNILTFHASQRSPEPVVRPQPGVTCWRESRPIESVGLYVPGGSAVLPSSVLMLGLPAKLAGCPRVCLCVPPGKDGRLSSEVLAAASIAGISEVYRIGGAQAIAALALGTASVPRVEKILGPGNRWVQAAKLLATLQGTAIDMVAGPSEVMVIADESSSPSWIAGDLISQAEHGPDSLSVLVSTEVSVVEQVQVELKRQLKDLPRNGMARQSLEQSYVMVVDSLQQGLEFANQYAPEHLILHLTQARELVGKVQSAGSVFLGAWSPEVAGDYASGTNHTLPTSGLARAYSGVSVDSFVKKITFQELTEEGLRGLGTTLEELARLEGLEGHRRAVSMRLFQGASESEP